MSCSNSSLICALTILIALEESLEVVFFDAEKKGIELICDVDILQTQDHVIGDQTRLRQILVNLLRYKISYNPSSLSLS